MSVLAQQPRPVLITELRPTIRVEVLSPRHRRITLGGVWWNANLRTLHDVMCGPPRADDTIDFFFEPGVLFLSRSTSEPALRTGRWPS